MTDLEKIKAERRKELVAILEYKKKELQIHFDQSANKAIIIGKGMMVAGAGAFILYTIFDRYLESKFRDNTTHSNASKSATTKLMYPFFSMALQESASLLFNQGQKIVTNYFQRKKRTK